MTTSTVKGYICELDSRTDESRIRVGFVDDSTGIQLVFYQPLAQAQRLRLLFLESADLTGVFQRDLFGNPVMAIKVTDIEPVQEVR